MIDPGHINKILKINGISSEAPEENIRSVLLSARYDQDEIDTALLVLRQNEDTKKVHVEGLHKVFRTNEALAPKEITKLLGIEVDASHFVAPVAEKRGSSGLEFFAVWLLSVLFAVIGVLILMHLYQVGPFHPSATL